MMSSSLNVVDKSLQKMGVKGAKSLALYGRPKITSLKINLYY